MFSKETEVDKVFVVMVSMIVTFSGLIMLSGMGFLLYMIYYISNY